MCVQCVPCMHDAREEKSGLFQSAATRKAGLQRCNRPGPSPSGISQQGCVFVERRDRPAGSSADDGRERAAIWQPARQRLREACSPQREGKEQGKTPLFSMMHPANGTSLRALYAWRPALADRAAAASTRRGLPWSPSYQAREPAAAAAVLRHPGHYFRAGERGSLSPASPAQSHANQTHARPGTLYTPQPGMISGRGRELTFLLVFHFGARIF